MKNEWKKVGVIIEEGIYLAVAFVTLVVYLIVAS